MPKRFDARYVSKLSNKRLSILRSNLHHESSYYGLYAPWSKGKTIRRRLELVELELSRRVRRRKRRR